MLTKLFFKTKHPYIVTSSSLTMMGQYWSLSRNNNNNNNNIILRQNSTLLLPPPPSPSSPHTIYIDAYPQYPLSYPHWVQMGPNSPI